MAFNMKRPIIQGTVLHKTSIALAKKKSIVTPASVGADQALIQASNWLGESTLGQDVDFKIDQSQRKIPKDFNKGKKKKKKEETEEERLARLEAQAKKDAKKTAKKDKKGDKLSTEFDAYVDHMQSQRLDNQILNEDDWLALSKRERRNLTKSDKPGTVLSRTLDKIREKRKEAKTEKERKRLLKEELKVKQRLEEEKRLRDLENKPTKLDPKPFDTTLLPTHNLDDKLIKADKYVPKTTADTDRFVDAAEERGYDMTTEEGWKKAELNGKYNDETDKWEFFGIADTSEEYSFETDQELINVQQEQADKLAEEKAKKEAEKLAKKKALKKEAKEFYDEHDEEFNQESFDEYLKMKKEGTLDGYGYLDIEEEYDPEPGDAGYEKFLEEEKKREFINKDDNNNNIPDYLEVEPENKYKVQDESDDFNTSDLEREKSGPIEQQRNDRIWGYAKQGGPLQENMRKSGYIPQEER